MPVKKFPLKDTNLKFPHSFLLDASAGSGKTYNLANRYIQFLLSNNIKENYLSNILAVTFTDNATKEMKKRIIDFLKDIYLKKEKRKEFLPFISLSEDELKNKADEYINIILNNYIDFNVGTIDSFITKIISVSLDELNINPDFELIFDNKKLISEIIGEFFKTIKTENQIKLIDNFLYTLNNSGGERFDFLPLEEIKEKFNDFLEKENKFLSEIEAINEDEKTLHILQREISDKILKLKERYDKLSPDIYKDSKEAILTGNYKLLIESYKPDTGIFYKKFADKIINDEFFIKLHNEIFEKIRLYYKKESEVFYKAYVDLYKIFKEFFVKNRYHSKFLSLSDITKELAFYIRKENIPEIYLKLSSDFQHFLIDEFQDTSLAQWNIFNPLIEEALSKRGSLFLIGDTKQAIYMFRNADYKIMNAFKNNKINRYLNTAPLEKGVECFSLDINYRSDEKILDYVNSFFSSEKLKMYINENIGKDLTGLLNSRQKLYAKNKNSGYVETIVINKKEDNENNIFKEKFLEIIKDLVDRFDLNDITILVRKNEEVEQVVSWLNEIMVPSASFSSLDIRKRKIISEIILLLQFLDNPEDNFSFNNFLLGDIFNKKDEMENFLFEIRDFRGPKYIEFRKYFKDWWNNYFEEIFNKTDYVSAYEIINLIYTKFELYKRFPDEQSFLLKFMDISYKFNVNENSSSISDFLDYIYSSEFDDESFSISMPPFLNAVKVMTFHKAKGLGFGVVINMFIESKTPSKNIYYCPTQTGIKIKRIVKNYIGFSQELDSIYNAERIEDEIQMLNTLYVAMTRAKHELYNLVKVSENSQKLYSLFENFKSGKKRNFKSKAKKISDKNLVIKVKENARLYDFIRNNEIDNDEILRGNVYHYILSQINKYRDLGNINFILENASYKYEIENLEKIKIKLLKIFSDKNFSVFFEEKEYINSENEVEFVDSGRVYRIDRLIELKDKVVIIDYKTGKESDYSKQINLYKKIVSQFYSKPVKGYIYYIDLEKLIEV